MYLMELDTLCRFWKDNFCDFLFALLCNKPPSEKGSVLKGKNLLPNSFLLEQTPFQKGNKTFDI